MFENRCGYNNFYFGNMFVPFNIYIKQTFRFFQVNALPCLISLPYIVIILLPTYLQKYLLANSLQKMSKYGNQSNVLHSPTFLSNKNAQHKMTIKKRINIIVFFQIL